MELRTTLPLHGDADELLGATTVRPTHAAVYSRASTVLLTSLEGEARYLGQELRATADAARDLSDPWPHGAWYLASHLPPGGLPESLLREMVAFSCLLTNHMGAQWLPQLWCEGSVVQPVMCCAPPCRAAGNNGAIFGDWPEMSPIQDYGDNGGNDYNNLNIDDDDDDDDDDDNLSSTDWQSIRWA
ncbi:hypothetical protein Ct61P_00001 [Colletotrichum tofieldiae]|nr:hypothetical protein Ct61P_00001 [Colletotrichum tofieldiae]